MPRHPRPTRLLIAALLVLTVVAMAACASPTGSAPAGRIPVVGAENEYANVLSQIGGRYVQVTAIMSNPNIDPHTFEASARVAQEVAAARVVVQNGLGYDDFMTQIEKASDGSGRDVIVAQHTLGLPARTPNPHLWYEPKTMPAVARRIARDLSTLEPAHRAYFRHNLTHFDRSLTPWRTALQQLATHDAGAPVAVTEPVPDYLLQAARLNDRTPWELQADIMNGVDLSPQNVTLQENLLRRHQVKALLYNEQVTDPTTQRFLSVAVQSHVPVVAVYETMPPAYTYQSWMLAETRALQRALEDGTSSQHL